MFIRIQDLTTRTDQRPTTMKRRFQVACSVALLGIACGCSGSHSSADDVALPEPDLWQTPLTIDDWKRSTDIEKYSPEVLQRLREHNPELRPNKEWKAFYEEVVAPGFHGDMSTP